MRTLFVIHLCFLAVIGACCAQTNTLEDAILAFPDGYGDSFRPDETVRVANALIAAGESRACAALACVSHWEDNRMNPAYDEKVLLLCRLLFKPKDTSKPIKWAYDGLRMPVSTSDYARWPDYPFVITNGVPVVLPTFVSSPLRLALKGPEPGWNYVQLCENWGTFRTEPFPMPTLVSACNAVNQVLGSADWQSLEWRAADRGQLGAPPKDWAEQKIWTQVENMKKPVAVQRPAGREEFP